PLSAAAGHCLVGSCARPKRRTDQQRCGPSISRYIAPRQRQVDSQAVRARRSPKPRLYLEQPEPVFARPRPVQYHSHVVEPTVSTSGKPRPGFDANPREPVPEPAGPDPTRESRGQQLDDQLYLRSVFLAARRRPEAWGWPLFRVRGLRREPG